MILSHGNHFCYIILDPIPLGDLNIFYDGMKQGHHYKNLVPFAGSYKPVVGSYEISQLWYIRKKFEMVTEPNLVSKSIPDPSDNPNQDEVDEIANGI